MEITIGLQNTPRELEIESALPAKEVSEIVAAAVKDSSGTLELTDTKGRMVIVPVAALAYIEIGAEESRKVGFGAI